jgi:hypothetical protein
MVTPNLRRLAAPMVAQAVSFVVVLGIGVLFVASPPSVHRHLPKVQPSASPVPTVTVTLFALSVQATAHVPLAGRQVTVLRAATLASAASGALDSKGLFTAHVPVGSYQVCLSVPAGLEVADGSASGLRGWACSVARVQAGASRVTFSLVPPPNRMAR